MMQGERTLTLKSVKWLLSNFLAQKNKRWNVLSGDPFVVVNIGDFFSFFLFRKNLSGRRSLGHFGRWPPANRLCLIWLINCHSQNTGWRP